METEGKMPWYEAGKSPYLAPGSNVFIETVLGPYSPTEFCSIHNLTQRFQVTRHLTRVLPRGKVTSSDQVLVGSYGEPSQLEQLFRQSCVCHAHLLSGQTGSVVFQNWQSLQAWSSFSGCYLDGLPTRLHPTTIVPYTCTDWMPNPVTMTSYLSWALANPSILCFIGVIPKVNKLELVLSILSPQHVYSVDDYMWVTGCRIG